MRERLPVCLTGVSLKAKGVRHRSGPILKGISFGLVIESVRRVSWRDLGNDRGNPDLACRLVSLIPNNLTASRPAFVALFMATVATGTPLGICVRSDNYDYKSPFFFEIL
nr:hypothetical protein Iba_chr05eCG10560 [Ipomoea batatas]